MSKKGKGAALKYDGGKPDLSLVSPWFKEGVARALMFGEKKYGRWNYLGGFEIHRLLSSAERHLDAIKKGEDVDPESGEPHWAHLAANVQMICDCAVYGTLKDNRPPRPRVAREKGPKRPRKRRQSEES
jgi:hypothetical protein